MQTSFDTPPACLACGFDLWLPIAAFGVSTLGFYNDGRFPGRCILMLNEHWDHPHLMGEELTTQFALDQTRAARAIMAATGAVRMNYAVLGNTVSHVHSHLIPRHSSDPIPTRPIWEHPDKQFKLAVDERDQLMAKILYHLAPD